MALKVESLFFLDYFITSDILYRLLLRNIFCNPLMSSGTAGFYNINLTVCIMH